MDKKEQEEKAMADYLKAMDLIESGSKDDIVKVDDVVRNVKKWANETAEFEEYSEYVDEEDLKDG